MESVRQRQVAHLRSAYRDLSEHFPDRKQERDIPLA